MLHLDRAYIHELYVGLLTNTLTETFSTMLRRHISSIGAIKAQVWVQFRLDVEADDRRCLQLLRVDVDAIRLEAGTRSCCVALEDEAFGLLGVETLIVPAGLCWGDGQLSAAFLGWYVDTLLTVVRQLPSPGLSLLMSPVKLAKVKFRSSTLELFGRSAAPELPWSM